ncbi:MAG: histidine kinase, partial [Spirosoma sp.]|nr:histidine kinase [Spirosoma sp.]
FVSITGPIICIEDDDDDQHLVSVAIKELQVSNELHFFGDGEAALEFLKSTPLKPFLILCDTNLPRMNGIELRKCLSENEYLRKKSIPFLFITTAASPALVQTAYDVTVQGYFKKPSTFKEMKQQLELIITYWRECIHPNSDF